MTTPAQLGKYQITEVLGTGAMGVVYKGFDPGIRRIVAIKTIRRELIAGDRPGVMMLKRFRNEAQAAGRLSHPGIVAVYDYGEDAEVAYIAMEYVEGNSLREYFARGSRFSERDAVSIMSQLLEALAHAHERRVWHRDIKPGNLIIMMNGRVKVADFGIARIEASDLTQTGAVLGSPGYMAPEQYAAAAIDHRADVFAAGVVFYQLLTGSRPFVGTAEQLAYAICHTEPARPSIADPGKGWERYDALIAKALAKRPEDRFQTAEAFRAALLEAHARPAAAAVSEETIITEILRPAAAMEPTVPSGSRAAQPAPSAKPPKRWGWAVGAGLVAVLAAVGVAWVSRKEAPPSPPPQPVAAAPAAPASRPQSGEEVVFWESVRGSTNRAEFEAYLAKYPDGAFAPLARARLEALAAAAAAPKAAAVAPPEPRKATTPPATEPARPSPKTAPSQEALFWESVRASTNPAELRAYLAKYPDGTFAPLARTRLDALAAVEAKRAAESQARPAIAAAAPARSYAGRWKGMVACEAFEGNQPFTDRVNVAVQDDAFVLERGAREQPGWFSLRGTPDATGNLQLLGTGVSGLANYRGKPYAASFAGRLEGDRYDGRGLLGRRNCTISIARTGG
ncbi:MAG TPA: serine/threonine-protein kinase [Burkholderiales bacterium]|nr:serine/threonine-protein kinase [Burkholderiales bacterium]